MKYNKSKGLGWRGIMRAGVLVLAAGLLTAGFSVDADEREDTGPKAGEVAPLKALLARVKDSYPGHILEVELEREGHGSTTGWIYEVKLLTQGGRVLKLEYDANSLELLQKRGRHERDDEDD